MKTFYITGMAGLAVVFGLQTAGAQFPPREPAARRFPPQQQVAPRQQPPQRQSAPRQQPPQGQRQPAPRQPQQPASPLDTPLRLALHSRQQVAKIRDYECVFFKRERIKGKLQQVQKIHLKVRHRPFSVYMKWLSVHPGREVIYVHGQNDNKMLVHDTGLVKALAGTLELDPRGSMAMKESRHSILETGLYNLVHQLATRWDAHRKRGKTQARLFDNAKVGDRVCVCVETIDPHEPQVYTYHRTRVYFDKQTWLPVRMEGYSWPTRGAPEGELVEEYTYTDLKFNVGLGERDFSAANPEYSFGRF